MDRPWEQPSRFVADDYLWHTLHSRWLGLAGAMMMGLLSAVATHFAAGGTWWLAVIAGAATGAAVWGLIYVALWGIVAPRLQRNAAAKHIGCLERKPRIRLGDTLVREGSRWFLPVTNDGPGEIRLYGTLRIIENAHHWEWSPVSFNRIEYVRWEGGSGDALSDSPNWKRFEESKTFRLEVADDGGGGTTRLSDESIGKQGKLLASNVKADGQFSAPPFSSLGIVIQVLGEQSLAKRVEQQLTLTLPSLKEGPTP